jgi:hypothetical protein
VQAVIHDMATAVSVVAVAVVTTGGALMAVTRGYVRRTIDSTLTKKVHDEVAEQMQPVVKKVDDMSKAQKRNEEKWDVRLRTIENNGARIIGMLEAQANQ